MNNLSPRVRNLLMVALVAVVMAGLFWAQRGTSGSTGDHHTSTSSSVSGSISVGDLPSQARDTLALIKQGGPYPFPRNDDVVFDNREGLLPSHPKGYYREYTVITPGSPDRGTRRIIVGHDGEYYYTDDHYRSFRRIEGVT